MGVNQPMPKAATPGANPEAQKILQETWNKGASGQGAESHAMDENALAKKLIESARTKGSAPALTKDHIHAVLKRSEWDLAKWAGKLSGAAASEKMAVPLCLAAALGWDKGVRILLAAGAKWWRAGAPMRKNSNSNSPALTWTWRNYAVPGVLASPMENMKSIKKNAHYTALAYAAMNGRESCVKLLVEHRRSLLPRGGVWAPLPSECLITNLAELSQKGCASFAIEAGESGIASLLIKSGAGSRNLQEEVGAAVEMQNLALIKKIMLESMTSEKMGAWEEVDRRARRPRELLSFLMQAQQSSLIACVVALGAEGAHPAWKESMRGEALLDAVKKGDHKCAIELAKGTRFHDHDKFTGIWNACGDAVIRKVLDDRHPVWARQREESRPRAAETLDGVTANEGSDSRQADEARVDEAPAAEISAQEKRERAFKDLDAFEQLIQEMSAAARQMRASLEGQVQEGMDVGARAHPSSSAHTVQASLERARDKLAQRIPEPPRRAATPSGSGKDTPQ